jgi:murein L,D-transpeptidase YcbB/YkuD
MGQSLIRPTVLPIVVTAAAVACAACQRTAEPKPAPSSASAPALVEPPGPPAPEVQAAVQGVLDAARHPWLRWPTVSHGLPALRRLYAPEAEPDGLFWFAGSTPYPELAAAVEALGKAKEEGLDPEDYDAARLASEWKRISAPGATLTDRGLFDIALTIGAIRYISSAHQGRVDPRLVGFDYDVNHKRLDLEAVLRASRGAGGLEQAREDAEPPFPVYHRLIKALAEYRAIAAAGEPPIVPPLEGKRKKIEPGQPWAGAMALAARLKAFRDLPADARPPDQAQDGTPLYAGALVEAVKSFQDRHVLEPDGVIGAGTITALNVPVAKRVRQIELALERERWLPEMVKQPLIFVNVSLFRLWAYDPEKPDEPLRMNVVVGKSLGHATPVFVDQLEYIIFRPYWSPPPSILKKEIVPHARRDASYLERQNMEIVASGDENAPSLPATPENLDQVASGRLYLRQKPGEKNSLGLAKFIFPNSENVYMHGTPAQSLFARARRDFSHGCIRLEDPAALALWVLRKDPTWTRERIDAAMKGDRPTQVNLKEKLTVILFYDTAYVGSSGRVRFTDDYYGHDARLEQALKGGFPYPRTR